jgi:hypothetical protein
MSDDVVFSNTALTNSAISTIYNVFLENNSYRNRMWLQLGVNTDIEYRSGWSSGAVLSTTKSDDLFALYNPNATIGDGYNNSDAANPWNRMYEGIEDANLAIAGIRLYGNPQEGNDMGQFLGEALTLRAYFYYDLIKWWGDVPARFDPVTQDNLYIPKSDRDIIYNQIIKDLQEAVTLMYSPGASSYTNTTLRVSKDAARGLLARICLSAAGYSMRPSGNDAVIKITATSTRRNELYTIARQACKDIITDNHYLLATNFKDIFYDQCQNVITQGREAIWQLPYAIGTRGRMLYNLGLPRDADGVHNTVTVGGQFRVTPSFFYDYTVGDTRRDITVVPYNSKKSSAGYIQDTLSSGIVGFNLGKWRAEWLSVPCSGTDDGVPPIVLRFADVLLMYAEADLYLNGNNSITSGDAYTYFNMVRRRAFGIPTGTASAYDLPVTLDNIQNERAFELCGENIRKYDLERWGILKTKMDQAQSNLFDLRNQAGNYTNVPATLYIKYRVDNSISPGEKKVVVYGLNKGETVDKIATDPTGGWIKKTWIDTTKISTGYIRNMYWGNPDKRQLLPIMHQIIVTNNGVLSNDYGYDN